MTNRWDEIHWQSEIPLSGGSPNSHMEIDSTMLWDSKDCTVHKVEEKEGGKGKESRVT